MGSLWNDVRYAARVLGKSPGFTAVAVVTLALGIGANTAIFSVVDSLLLRALPVKDAEQITLLAFQQKHGPLNTNFSVPEYRDIRTQSTGAFSSVVGYQFGLDGLSVNGRADRIVTYYVTGNFFSGLGIKPALGRFIRPGEGEIAGADPVMVLGYSYWQSHFGGNPDVIGSKVSVDGHPITIIGVAPKGFYGIYSVVDTQGYLPLGMLSIEGYPSNILSNRALRNVYILGRLRSGVSVQRADAALSIAAQRISREHPENDKDLSIQAFPEIRARPEPDPQNTVAVISGLFLGLAALVLLLACVNVANILMVRATVRQREMAIRTALGAARSSLIRQLLTESILLALVGGAAGILLGYWGSAALSSIHLQTDLPVRFDFGFDWRIFCYGFAAALLTGVIVGIAPALRMSRGNLNEILHISGRGVVGGRHRMRNVLVMAQVGGSLTLLIIAGLFTRSLAEVQRANLGFNPNHVVNFTMDPNEIGYSQAQGRTFYKNLLDRIRELPGVVSASTANSIPMGYYNNGDNLLLDGVQQAAGQPPPAASYNVISPDYFKTMAIGTVAGRRFTDADNDRSQFVAIVNQAMAKRYWPKQDPIGRRFKLASDPKQVIQVIGIVKDSRYQGASGPIGAFFYLPFAQHYASNSLETLQARTAADPTSMIPEIEHAIASLAPNLPVFDVKTMEQALYTLNGLLLFQIAAALAAVLGLLGLILAVVGVYGVISYATTQRTHEVGVRMALGARPVNILTMMISQGLVIVGAGLVIGIAAAMGCARVVGTFLTVSATDPQTYIAVSAVLAIVAILACYIPARRAMRIDPMMALRYE